MQNQNSSKKSSFLIDIGFNILTFPFRFIFGAKITILLAKFKLIIVIVSVILIAGLLILVGQSNNQYEQELTRQNTDSNYNAQSTLTPELIGKVLDVPYFNQYLESRNYSIKTIESYNKSLAIFLQWLNDENINDTNTTYNDVMAFIRSRTDAGNSKEYVQKQLTVVRHYFNYLIRIKKVKDNITANINIKGIKRRLPHDILSVEELEQIYTNYNVNGIIGKRNKVILGLMIYQGIGTEYVG